MLDKTLIAIQRNPLRIFTFVAGVVLLFFILRIFAYFTNKAMLTAEIRAKLAPLPLAERERFTELFAKIMQMGYEVIITSVVRNGTDPHSRKHAVDFNIKKNGKQYFKATPKEEWEATGVPALIRKLKFRWGGDFKNPYFWNGEWHPAYDPVHADTEINGKY